MPEPREYHIEEFTGVTAFEHAFKYERPSELAAEGWSHGVVQWLERADGSAFQVLIMSRPRKPSFRFTGGWRLGGLTGSAS